MKRLTVDGISSLPDVPTQDLKITDWDVSVRIELGKLLETGELDAFDYQKKLLMTCVTDPKLSEEDVDKLYEKDAQVIDQIFLAINDLNGIGGSATAEEFPE